MKTKLLLFYVLLLFSLSGFSTVWTITNVGDSFSPSSITINEGDTVVFQLSGEHNALEVSQQTWDANGASALTGGFQTSFGGGTVLPAQLGPGTHYYVCVPHASIGMKGTIVVEAATSLDQQTIQAKLSVFPNPVQNQLWVESSVLQASFIIYDQVGRAVISGTLHDRLSQIDIAELATGVYFFQIENQNVEKVKFIKK